jgi:hypothetical protein
MFLGINERIMQGTLGDVPFAGAVSCKKLHFASLLFSSNATTNDMAIPLSTTGLRGRGKKKRDNISSSQKQFAIFRPGCAACRSCRESRTSHNQRAKLFANQRLALIGATVNAQKIMASLKTDWVQEATRLGDDWGFTTNERLCLL